MSHHPRNAGDIATAPSHNSEIASLSRPQQSAAQGSNLQIKPAVYSGAAAQPLTDVVNETPTADVAMKAKRHTLANALRVAADQFAADALFHKTRPSEGLMPPASRVRMTEQFERQAIEVRKLADEIEQADRIDLED